MFGVGLGYRDVEFNAFGVPKGQRVKRFEEYLELIVRLWTEESVTYHSETCQLDNGADESAPGAKAIPPNMDFRKQRPGH